jgi:uncharacterized protein (DUF362 family)
MSDRRVVVASSRSGLAPAIHGAATESGLLGRIRPDTRVALKPNFTYPRHKPGVTTSPEMIRETVRLLRQATSHVAIVESDGGYGSWSAQEAFHGHELHPLCEEFGVELVNLCDEPREIVRFESMGRETGLPLPTRLLHETDLFVTLPVPKIHSLTGVTLGYKNQWGCIPDTMRLRSHYVFNDGIVAINRSLRPMVLADGAYFLDRSGPLDGVPVRMDLIVGASDVGAFDRYVSDLMGFPWRRVAHLRHAARLGDMPARLEDISFNAEPAEWRTHTFRLRRTPRNWVALAGFNSRSLTWLGYESWFGRVVLHELFYAVIGRPAITRTEARPPGA